MRDCREKIKEVALVPKVELTRVKLYSNHVLGVKLDIPFAGKPLNHPQHPQRPQRPQNPQRTHRNPQSQAVKISQGRKVRRIRVDLFHVDGV